MTKKEMKLVVLLTALLCLYVVTGFFLDRMGVEIKLRWLYWNLFLAFLPLVFACPATALIRTKKAWMYLSIPFLLAWILFLPNSCYMVTDLIHLDSSEIIVHGQYVANLKEWIALIYLGAGIFLALVIGLASTGLIANALELKKHRFLNLTYVTIISLLVGYGVYIGRFLRFNTWDILHPLSLIKSLWFNLDRFAILFSMMMAVFYFGSTLIYQKIEDSSRK